MSPGAAHAMRKVLCTPEGVALAAEPWNVLEHQSREDL